MGRQTIPSVKFVNEKGKDQYKEGNTLEKPDVIAQLRTET